MDRSCSPSLSSCSDSNPRIDASNVSVGTRDVLKSIMKTRKSWKSFKDGEVVWPLELEAALLEGLEKYVPQDTRETRILGRFPMRNRFISDYIYEKTGKRRTAKQVGSRIQQLRDTCAGKRLSELLRPCPSQEPSRCSSSPKPYGRKKSSLRCDMDGFSDASSSEISPSLDDRSLDETSDGTDYVNVVYIDLLPPNEFQSEVDQSARCHGLPPCLTNHADRVNYIQISQQPRHLRHIDPTITFVSLSDIRAQSVFTVRVQDTVVFTETAPLITSGQLNNDGQLYSTTLVPGYWDAISRSADPTKFTIEQKVLQAGSAIPLFSAVYKFRVSPETRNTCPPPQSLTDYLRVPGEHPNRTTTHHDLYTDIQTELSAAFDIGSSLETLDHFITLENDDILAEIELQSASWVPSNSPSAQSSSSLLSASANSSRHNSVSPAGSCTSEVPSPIIYPTSTAPSPTPYAFTAAHFPVPKPESFLGLDCFGQDIFDCVTSQGFDVHCS